MESDRKFHIGKNIRDTFTSTDIVCWALIMALKAPYLLALCDASQLEESNMFLEWLDE